MSWPWGAYLGEEGLTQRASARRSPPGSASPPNVVPHVVEGDRRLPELDARGAPRRRTRGYDEAILLTPEGTVADGSGENIFVVRDGVLYTPDLSTGILPGHHARHDHRRSRHDLGYTVIEKALIRSDLYLADEVFMCGTAAEVTPLRSVDDHEIGVGDGDAGDPEGVPRHGARRRASAGRTGSTSCRSSRAVELGRHAHGSTSARPGSTSATRSSCSRCCARAGSRSARPGRASRRCSPTRSARRYCAAVSSGTAGLHLCMRLAGVERGRRGDHVAVLVRRLGELRDLRGRDAGLRRHRPAHVQPRSGGGRGGDHAADEGDRRGRHLRLPVRARRADPRSASGTASR